MNGGASGSDAVAGLLGRAVEAGLARRWVGLAAREGGAGMCWSAGGSQADGAEAADLRFDLASLTKPLATATLLLLARRDGLDLGQPVADLVPELAGPPWGGVTVAQCATHTAGFPAWAPLYAGGCGRDAYLETLRQVRPVAAAGARVEYSCLGFIVLGIALERAGGADLGALFAELVAEPLGLADELGFAPPAAASVAPGERRWYVEEGLLAARGVAAAAPPALAGTAPCDDGNARGLGGAAGNAGLFGTAAAVARLAAEYLPGGGELLDAAEAELATRCRTEGLGQARGVGWQLASSPGCSAGPALPPSAFGHTGFTGVSVWSDPGSRAVYVLLGNRLHPSGRTPDLHPLRRRFHVLAGEAIGEGARWGARD
ncbi:MAG: class A beta-lactamase-related serine hydrolase [Acidobacteria bacterium]|nr:MAG: class A beta-lactamase-related serine hydrolase [Acidobacteriota bacterium]